MRKQCVPFPSNYGLMQMSCGFYSQNTQMFCKYMYEKSIVSSVTIPVVGPGLVSTSPARRRRRRIPMMLLLDHTFMRCFACIQCGFLLHETALLLTQVCFTAGCRWQRIFTSILDCVSQWHNKVYLASLTKCSLQNQNFSKYLVTTIGDSMLIVLGARKFYVSVTSQCST